jgi:polyphosphate glucokinase
MRGETSRWSGSDLPGPENARKPGKGRGGQVLSIDIGGHKVKALAQGGTEPRKAASGPDFTPGRMLKVVRELARGWKYDAVSIGYPGLVGRAGPLAEAGNLGPGWVGFEFEQAFKCPVRFANDAAMQALGSYEGGRMLFLGLGTGLGSALVMDRIVLSLELAELAVDGSTLGEMLGRKGLKALGKKKWRKLLLRALPPLQKALLADHVILGGGSSKHVRALPAGVRTGNNLAAFRGGVRMWAPDPRSEDAPYWTFL